MMENARWMETLETKVKQLITALQELAIQAGDAGLMDLTKGAIEALTGRRTYACSDYLIRQKHRELAKRY